MFEESAAAMAKDTFHLSNSQMNIWNLEQAYRGTSINVISETIRIQGTFDVALIQRCLNHILESDGSLRTQITLVDQVPMQYEAPYQKQLFPVYDFSTTDEEGIHCWEEAASHETMPILDQPLCQFRILKLGVHEGGLLIRTHHIISDGWSQVLLINRIADTYLALLAGESIPLDRAPSYRLHVDSDKAYRQSKAYERDKKYWAERMAIDALPVSLKACPSADISPIGRELTFELSQTLSQKVFAFCNQYRVAPFVVYYMALAIYLKRIGGADKFRIGVPIYNRTNATERETSGMFVSTLPFVGEVDDNWSYIQFMEDLTIQWFNILRHQRFPLMQIVELASNDDTRFVSEPLYHIALSFQNSKIYCNKDASILFTGQWNYSGYQAEHLCIHLSNMENERRYLVNYVYLAQLFSEKEIRDFHHYLTTILSRALDAPDKPIWQLPVLGDAELEKVVFAFNQTDPPKQSEALWEKLQTVAKRHAKRVAVIQNGVRTTYETLFAKAHDVAHSLSTKVEQKNALVAVLLERSADLFSAMAGIISAGHAWTLLSPQWPVQRIREVLEDGDVKAVITTGDIARSLDVPQGVALMDIASLPESNETVLCSAGLDDLAYVVYTSGSTGKPKGVEIQQRSLINFCEAIRPLLGHDAILSVCNVSFDAFIIDSICALYHGQTVVLPAQSDIEDPAKLAALIRQYAVDFMSMTPSRLMTYCKNRSFCQALRRIDSIMCGGEHFPNELLKLLKRYSKTRVYNQYGPSETTIGVSCRLLNDASMLSVGKPMAGCRMYVLDEHRQPLPVGVYGELYIGGLCVGRGYRNAPEQTAKAFVDNPFEYGERMYRTGDIACWTESGEILLRGRKDDQVKLRGLRIEPQEVAARVAMHEAVEQAFVRVYEENGEAQLVAYYTSKKPIAEHELLTFSATYLPVYMIPSVFMRLDSVPITANGKIDYAQLPTPSFQVNDGRPQQETRTQRSIVAIFSRVLGRDDLNAASDYFKCGGNSLNALETLSALEELFGIRLRTADLWACRNAIKLEARILEQDVHKQEIFEIARAPENIRYPLTSIQQSIYVQSNMDPTQLAYNMPGALRFTKGVDRHRLDDALHKLVQDHSILRTRFVMDAEGIHQMVDQDVSFAVEKLEATDLKTATEQFVRPFDLYKAPLFRAALWEQNEHETVLFIDMHHIIGDGLSTPILIKQLDALYCGKEPQKARLEFKDYAWWMGKNQADIPAALKTHWQQVLDGYEGPCELPLDQPRPRQFDFQGDTVMATLPHQSREQIQAYCEHQGITPYMLFMAAFGILLGRIASTSDIVVGTPVAGRPRSECMQVVGSFIQTLPLRIKPQADLAVFEYIQQVKSSVLDLLDHQQMPMEAIIAMAGGKRELGSHALYNTMLTMRPVNGDGFVLDGIKAEAIELPTHTSKLDLSLEIYSRGDGFGFTFEYATSLFYRRTVEFFARSFLSIVQSILSGNAATVAQLDGMDIQDRIRLLERPHYTRTPFVDLPLDRQIEQMAALTPDAPAILLHGKTTTYADLMRRAKHISGRLVQQGAKRGDVIGLALCRGVDLIAAMIGITRLGCAYMPMLASFPHDRLRYMVETAKTALVLCDNTTKDVLPEDWQSLLVHVEGQVKEHTPPRDRSGDDLMHVLFTSGSTGKPKGVMVHHRAISNLHTALTPMFEEASGNVLCTTNVVFDTFITESLLPLCHGRCIVMADEEDMMLPWRMAALIEQEDVRVMALTPSRLQMCLGNDAFNRAVSNLSLMILAGEALSISLRDKLRARSDLRIMNLYGPTEAAVYATMADVTDVQEMVIGKPLANCRAYVLDENRQPVMPTALGELYLAGECVAKGYIGQEVLTAEVFLEDVLFAGQTMYKTGDIVRLLPDGNLCYIGRRDTQVKFNGQRVELGEITNQIIAAKLADEAATIAYKPDEAHPMRLRLYVVADKSRTVSEQEIKNHLMSQLPAYMVPSEIVHIASLPRTATGKTDLLALRRMATLAADAAATITKKVDISQGDIRHQRIQIEVDAADRESAEIGQAQMDRSVEGPIVHQPEMAANDDEHSSAKDKPDEAQHVKEDKKFDEQPAQRESGAHIKTVSSDDLLPLWRQVLASDRIGKDVSFFDQGGTSLGALHLLSLYFNQGYKLTLAQFYENPTLEQQVRILAKPIVPAEANDDPQRLVRETQTVRDGEHSPIQLVPNVQRDVVLLTGGTGFLGAHLVKALIDAGRRNVVCTVRGGNAARLWETLTWYFGPVWFRKNHRRITAVAGDVTQDNLGLDGDLHRGIFNRVGCIIHAAGDVRHHAQDDGHYRTNDEGTGHAIDLAMAWNVPLYHISTISVSGEYIVDHPHKQASFTEGDRDIGQNWRDNIYVKTKFMAEQRVFDAMKSGLDAKVFRVGRLVGRSSDGVFQRNAQNNAFYGFVVALQCLDQMPASFADMPIEITAVDECARAIVLLMDGHQSVYHVINPFTLTLRDLAKELSHPLLEVDDAQFHQHLMQKLSGMDYQKLAPLVDVYNRVVNRSVTVIPDCSATARELELLNCAWTKPDIGIQLSSFFNPAQHGQKGGD